MCIEVGSSIELKEEGVPICGIIVGTGAGIGRMFCIQDLLQYIKETELLELYYF
jgi:hypothetical protein